MFIDYVPLMLINMAVGLFLLASLICQSSSAINQKRWAAGFIMTGTVALINGCRMTWTWPLPGSYNVAFGEMSVLFGILFLGAGLSLALGWELVSVALYGFFAGIAAIVVGARIINLGLTKEPLISGVGFILSGLGGVLAIFVIWFQKNRLLILLVSIILVIAAIIWLRIGYTAYWEHLSGLAKWVPQTMP